MLDGLVRRGVSRPRGCRVTDVDPYEQETAALEQLLEGLDETLSLMPDESPDWKALVWRFRASVLVGLSERRLRLVVPPVDHPPQSEAERLRRVV